MFAYFSFVSAYSTLYDCVLDMPQVGFVFFFDSKCPCGHIGSSSSPASVQHMCSHTLLEEVGDYFVRDLVFGLAGRFVPLALHASLRLHLANLLLDKR